LKPEEQNNDSKELWEQLRAFHRALYANKPVPAPDTVEYDAMGALVIKPQQKAILEQLSRFGRVQTPLSMSCRADGTAFIKRVLDNFGSLAIALQAVQQHFHEPGNFFVDATSLPRQNLESQLLLALSYEHLGLETMLLAVKQLNDSGVSFHRKSSGSCLDLAFSDPLDNTRSHKAIFDSTPEEHKPRLFDESFKPTHDLAVLLWVYPEQIKAVFNALFKTETYDGHRLVMAMEMLRSSADPDVAALFKHYQHHCNELHLAAEDPRRAILWGETPSIEECQDRLNCVMDALLSSPLPIPDPQLLAQRFIDLVTETSDLNDEVLAVLFIKCASHEHQNTTFCALESFPERIVVLESLIRYFTQRSVPVERLLVELDVAPPGDQGLDLNELIHNKQGLTHEYAIKYLLGGIGDQASYKFRPSALLAIVMSSTATEVLHTADFNDEQLLKLYRLTGDAVFRDRLALDHTREAALQHDLGM
jgi:hypothetical protein